MKWIKYTGHPVLVMSLYLLLLIEGAHFGGFFLLYLLMSLSVGALFAVTALIGLLIVFIGYKIYRKNPHPIKPILYILGFVIMIIALLIFFERKERLETFETTIPTFTFVLFGIVSLAYIINAFLLLRKSIFYRNDSFKMIA